MTYFFLGPRLNILSIWVAKSVLRWAFESNLISLKLLILLLRSHLQIVNSLLNWTVSQMKNWNRWVKVCTFDFRLPASDYILQNLVGLVINFYAKSLDVERETLEPPLSVVENRVQKHFVCIKPFHKRLVIYSHCVLSQIWWVVMSYVVDLVLLIALPLHDH